MHDSMKVVIETLYRQLLDPRWGLLARKASPDIGLLFTVHVDCANYGYEKDGKTFREDWVRDYRRTIFIVITARRRVYTLVSNRRTRRPIFAPGDWVNRSNHDSEWHHGLNIINEILLEAADHCFGFIPFVERPSSWVNAAQVGPNLDRSALFAFVQVTRMPLDGQEFDTLSTIEYVPFSVNLLP